jgi:hypothetical protein
MVNMTDNNKSGLRLCLFFRVCPQLNNIQDFDFGFWRGRSRWRGIYLERFCFFRKTVDAFVRLNGAY